MASPAFSPIPSTPISGTRVSGTTEGTRALAGTVAGLVEILGRKLTTYIAGAKSLAEVDRLASEGLMGELPSARLRAGLQIAQMLASFEAISVVQAWFVGMNPDLNDRAPIQVLREDDPMAGVPAVWAAARGFIARG